MTDVEQALHRLQVVIAFSLVLSRLLCVGGEVKFEKSISVCDIREICCWRGWWYACGVGVCSGWLRRRGLHGDTERVDWELKPGKVIIHKAVRDGGL